LATSSYIGRFAPSPTGPLHFGSLVTALASYQDARRNNGQWLVRIEDLDGPRCVPGADVEILRTLEFYGFEWDGPVLYQNTRVKAYEAALDELRRKGVAYAETNSIGATAWKANGFTVRRSDGPFAYQLAVVVDDAFQGITHVVRGADLLDSTPRQLWLQDQLGYPHPIYRHIPVVTNTFGQKLSKQTGAPALRREDKERDLEAARQFLLSNDRPLVHPHPAGKVDLP
jgi:glutamyl-Q tRNA(Asp) synthetase